MLTPTFRHGAIGPIEATPVGVNVDWIDFRIYTFELVIRLSNVQQMALPFCALTKSRGSCGPRDSSPMHFFIFEAVLNIQKPPSFAATFAVTLHETERRQVHDL